MQGWHRSAGRLGNICVSLGFSWSQYERGANTNAACPCVQCDAVSHFADGAVKLGNGKSVFWNKRQVFFCWCSLFLLFDSFRTSVFSKTIYYGNKTGEVIPKGVILPSVLPTPEGRTF